MNIQTIVLTATSVTLELINDKCFFNESYNVFLNGELTLENMNRNVFSLFNLTPGKSYEVKLVNSETNEVSNITFNTPEESTCVNVKDFGAVGDGITDDTLALQAAIMSCPDNGRVFIDAGTYLVKPLFLKSNITIELHKDAKLLGDTKRENYPILPGCLKEDSNDIRDYLGTWEGDPMNSFASLITGIGVKNVNIIGQGIIDGNGDQGDWWIDAKVMRVAWRPRTIFLNQCENVVIQGITVQNSPSWTVHPYFSQKLTFADIFIQNPDDSPNTDGLNPESCIDVKIIGVDFSVGDDCIALKSGKISMGKRFKQPSRDIVIRNCRMNFGHGAVVIGSEMAGGIINLLVKQCLFIGTDRGLRIKTRRGRGKDSITQNIVFENIKMQGVKTPLVINMFYFCDPDGKTEYVWSKDKLPVDDRTPYLGSFIFRDIDCVDAEIAAGYFYGLPEQNIESVILENVNIKMSPNGEEGYPAMMSHIEPMSQVGFYMNNVKEIILKNVNIEGAKDWPYFFENYSSLTKN